jgi:hypothetical protein
MASLLEVANVARSVTVRGVDVSVVGLSGTEIATLMARFPEVGKLMSGVEPDRKSLMKMAPVALNAFIAAGTGKAGDKATEDFAGTLGVGEQLDLIDEILRLTFPRGIGPFVEKLKGLGLLAAVDQSAQI